ncbi:hypothetical protein JTE90_017250 [Oedothorax gibbosus]|uniref:Chloride channel protein n=1 Tax=Oedothorax gibbosus TaxID=931172 RepID=A0AAV6VDM9_9ARAC|nr:hypothetical protein JTE90_017250 [Oedothorax gibbosus]
MTSQLHGRHFPSHRKCSAASKNRALTGCLLFGCCVSNLTDENGMENRPLTSIGRPLRFYESTQGVPSGRLGITRSFPSGSRRKRRHSSEGALIHITGTGTTSEEALRFKGRLEQLKEGSGHEESDESFPYCVGQYGDFHTIDWQRDTSRDSYRQKYIMRKMGESFGDWAYGCYDRITGWICVLIVGVAAGCVAGLIDIGESWLSDLKHGVCPEAFWLNKEQCCWSSNETFYEGDDCIQWASWYSLFGLEYFYAGDYALSYAFYVSWSLCFALLASTMVRTFAPYACGSGIPEIKTILGGFIMRGYLGKWTLVIKSMGTLLAVSAGLSLGKEGPLVHIVCCLGNVVSYLFPKYGKNEAKKREVLSAAAAAGVSIAFGAPIGGVLFSLEEVSYYFPMQTLWRSFFCALVATFVLRSIDPFGTDHLVKFYMDTTRPWVMIELVPFALLGVLGGVIGTAFIRCNTAWCRFRKSSRLGQFPIIEVVTVALVTSLISFPNEFTRMNASDLIKLLFSQCGRHEISPLCDYTRSDSTLGEGNEAGPGVKTSVFLLLLALVCKFLITIFTFGIKLPTGLFIPSLAMGAIMGRIVGVGMQQLAVNYRDSWPFHAACTASENCMAPGLYAVIGAASCLAGVTRMTVSLVVIMFELTGRVDYIVPLMTSVVASKWVGDAIHKEGIYDAHIRLNGYPYLNNKNPFRHATKALYLINGNALRTGIVCLRRKGMTLDEIEGILRNTSHNGFPITMSTVKPWIFGFVLRRDLSLTLEYKKKTNPEITGKTIIEFGYQPLENQIANCIYLNRIVDQAPLTVTVEAPMEMVIEMFCKLGLRQILVTEHGKVLGIITKKDILKHIQEVEKTEASKLV